MKKKARQVADLARKVVSGGADEHDLLETLRGRFEELPRDQRTELFHWLSDEFEVDLESVPGFGILGRFSGD